MKLKMIVLFLLSLSAFASDLTIGDTYENVTVTTGLNQGLDSGQLTLTTGNAQDEYASGGVVIAPGSVGEYGMRGDVYIDGREIRMQVHPQEANQFGWDRMLIHENGIGFFGADPVLRQPGGAATASASSVLIPS